MTTRRRKPLPPPPRLDESGLRASLDGIAFPAYRWLIVAWAEHNGASVELQTRLRELPERRYRSHSEVIGEIARHARRPPPPPRSPADPLPRRSW